MQSTFQTDNSSSVRDHDNNCHHLPTPRTCPLDFGHTSIASVYFLSPKATRQIYYPSTYRIPPNDKIRSPQQTKTNRPKQKKQKDSLYSRCVPATKGLSRHSWRVHIEGAPRMTCHDFVHKHGDDQQTLADLVSGPSALTVGMFVNKFNRNLSDVMLPLRSVSVLICMLIHSLILHVLLYIRSNDYVFLLALMADEIARG